MAVLNDNATFLYVVLRESTAKMDWSLVGNAMGLKSGTASMRYQRLKPRLEEAATAPSGISACAVVDDDTLLVYNCIKHSNCKVDFEAVGKATRLKTGTAAMRYRRLIDKIKRQTDLGDDAAAGSPAPSPATASTSKPNAKSKSSSKVVKGLNDKTMAGASAPVQASTHSNIVKKRPVEADTDGGEAPPSKRKARQAPIDYSKMLIGNYTTSSTDSSVVSDVSDSTFADSDISSVNEADASDLEEDSLLEEQQTKALVKNPSALEAARSIPNASLLKNALVTKPKLVKKSSAPVGKTAGKIKVEEDARVEYEDTDVSVYATPAASLKKSYNLVNASPQVHGQGQADADLATLAAGMPLISAPVQDDLQAVSPGVQPEAKNERESAATGGLQPARLRHSLRFRGSDLLQADIDRETSLSPEDSVSMVAQLFARVDDADAINTETPVETKSG